MRCPTVRFALQALLALSFWAGGCQTADDSPPAQLDRTNDAPRDSGETGDVDAPPAATVTYQPRTCLYRADSLSVTPSALPQWRGFNRETEAFDIPSFNPYVGPQTVTQAEVCGAEDTPPLLAISLPDPYNDASLSQKSGGPQGTPVQTNIIAHKGAFYMLVNAHVRTEDPPASAPPPRCSNILNTTSIGTFTLFKWTGPTSQKTHILYLGLDYSKAALEGCDPATSNVALVVAHHTSPTLDKWSSPQRVACMMRHAGTGKMEADAYNYPGILDISALKDGDPNLSAVGAHPYLVLTKFPKDHPTKRTVFVQKLSITEDAKGLPVVSLADGSATIEPTDDDDLHFPFADNEPDFPDVPVRFLYQKRTDRLLIFTGNAKTYYRRWIADASDYASTDTLIAALKDPTKDIIQKDPDVLYTSLKSDRPESFRNLSWLVVPTILEPDDHIYGMFNNDFHGNQVTPCQCAKAGPPSCTDHVIQNCRYTTLVNAISTDGGLTFNAVCATN